MMRRRNALLVIAAAAVFVTIESTGFATPYASAVRNIGGNMWEFVLNEPATSISISRDGGNTLTIPSPAAGRHMFDMTGFSSFEIGVQNNSGSGWSRISNASNIFTNFERPNGLAVNTNPASEFFGTIYVINGTTLSTVTGRTMGDGVYSMTADMVGVDLVTKAAIPLANASDPALAKLPAGWNVGGSSNSAWRMALDAAGNLIVTDWSDANGGIKYATPNLTGGGLVLDQQAGPTFGVTNGNGDYFHGSIVSKPYVTGSVGNNLTVSAMDEDLETVPFVSNDGNSVWRWDVGNATNYDGVPALVVNVGNIAPASNGGQNFLNLNTGILANAHYEPRFNKWYLTESRSDGLEAGLVVVSADGVDGNSPALNWSSLDFSIANNLDGWEDTTSCPTISEGINDIFRYAGSVAISPDGSTLFLHRSGLPPLTLTGTGTPCALGETFSYDNRYLGQNSNLPGAVLAIPLDANGVPNIQVDDNGTPGDPSDDFLSNLQSITIASNNNFHSRNEINFDAAGNLYLTNNISEVFEVWSPGGNTRAITRSNGTFEVMQVTGPTGDFNNDGLWNCADINALTAAIATGSTDLSFDMNGDGMVTLADVTDATVGWLAVGGANTPGTTSGNPYLIGDANLDGVVDGQDFIEWNTNKFMTNSAWCAGNFNGDSVVDGQDFIEWNIRKFMSSDGASAVPEPTCLSLLALAALGYLSRRIR